MPSSSIARIALLDYSTTEFRNNKLIQDGAIKYVEKKLRPNDFMAVLVLGSGLKVASDFTNDKAKLVTALKSIDLKGTLMASDRADLSVTKSLFESINAARPSAVFALAIRDANSATVRMRGFSAVWARTIASPDEWIRSNEAAANKDALKTKGLIDTTRMIDELYQRLRVQQKRAIRS
jgi:hypothetical protein